MNAVVPPQKIPVKNLKWVLTICNLKWSKGGYSLKYSMRNYVFPALKKMFQQKTTVVVILTLTVMYYVGKGAKSMKEN